jgi:iron(III) transport system substrate-binding protein
MWKITEKIIAPLPSVLLLILFLSFTGCQRKSHQVVVYTSLDQAFSEPILELFEQRTGIAVRTVYDIEAAKTVGLVNRLVAEKSNPQADVFWSSEIVQTIYLKKEDVLAPYSSPSANDIPERFKDVQGFWTGFGARARIIAYNPDSVDPEDVPTTIQGLTDSKWKNQVAIANPLFGTTSTHAAVLFARLGKEQAMKLFSDLKRNGVKIVSGNAHARDLVLRGKVKLCLTDTDDVVSAKDRGENIDMIFPDIEGIGTLLIPNSIALIKDNPHPEQGKLLIDFVLSREVEQLLANSSSAQLPVRKGITPRDEVSGILSAKIMDADFEEAYEHIIEANEFIKSHFIP